MIELLPIVVIIGILLGLAEKHRLEQEWQSLAWKQKVRKDFLRMEGRAADIEERRAEG